jgi:hypothetical protein
MGTRESSMHIVATCHRPAVYPAADRDVRPEQVPRPLPGGVASLIEAKIEGQPIKPRAVSAPAPVLDLMSALKRSLAQETPARVGRATKEKRTRGCLIDASRHCFYRYPVAERGRSSLLPRADPQPTQEGLGAAIDPRLAGAPAYSKDRSFGHFVLNGSALFGHFGQLGGPDSELFDSFQLDRSLLQISTSPCQLEKMAFVVH